MAAKGGEEKVIQWLQQNRGIWLPHIGTVRSVESLGEVYDSTKKADISINGIYVSLKNVEGSILINRLDRDAIINHYRFDPAIYDIKIQLHHEGKIHQNFSWKDVMDSKSFFAFLQTNMMSMSPKQGQSKQPAELILTHPAEVKHALDINVYTYNEFFKLFSDRWIDMRIKRCWFGQVSKSEHSRARRLAANPENEPWVFADVKGKPRSGWRSEIAPDERKTCYNMNVEIKAPFKWEEFRKFKLNLIDSGLCGISSKKFDSAAFEVEQSLGRLICSRDDSRWIDAVEIAARSMELSKYE